MTELKNQEQSQIECPVFIYGKLLNPYLEASYFSNENNHSRYNDV